MTATDAATASEARCLDCNAILTGEYCAKCGQHTKHHVHSTASVVGEFVEDLFHADHRVWRTLKPLLFSPGLLTNEYLRGRRTRYLPPFRLYIVLSLIFFLTASLSDHELMVIDGSVKTQSIDSTPRGQDGTSYAIDPGVAEQLTQFLTRVPEDKRAETRRGLEAALRELPTDQQAHVMANMSNPCSPDTPGAALPESPQNRARLLSVCRNVMQDNGKEFSRELVKHVPQMMFFFLPLIALYAKVLYLGSKRYYAEHLLFFVHFHAFVFLLLGANKLAGVMLGWFGTGWSRMIAGLLTSAVAVYAPIYLYRAMRNVYGQGRILTLTKFSLLLVGYAINLLVAFGVIVVFTAMTLSSH